jgi:hypothetical protein
MRANASSLSMKVYTQMTCMHAHASSLNRMSVCTLDLYPLCLFWSWYLPEFQQVDMAQFFVACHWRWSISVPFQGRKSSVLIRGTT